MAAFGEPRLLAGTITQLGGRAKLHCGAGAVMPRGRREMVTPPSPAPSCDATYMARPAASSPSEAISVFCPKLLLRSSAQTCRSDAPCSSYSSIAGVLPAYPKPDAGVMVESTTSTRPVAG